MNLNKRQEMLLKLKEKPLIKQRTEEWYKLRENRLTASDLYDAINNPHSLVKKKLKNVSYNSFAIPALKWGCMFEPIAINIYSHINNTKVNEFGLIVNDNIDNFGASPDGITDEGIMIEIKCPYKREIKDTVIPDKYYYQMQGQMAVCELDICDYVECKFITLKDENEYINCCDENHKHGIIAEFRDRTYIYSTFNQDFSKNIEEMNKHNDCILIYWKLELINTQRITFDEQKWNNKIIKSIQKYCNIYEYEKKNKPKTLFIEDSD